MANFEIDEEVLVAFLKGELDAAQAAAVEAWYDRSAANRRMLGQVYYILYVSDRINDAAGIDVERRRPRMRSRALLIPCLPQCDATGSWQYVRRAMKVRCGQRLHPAWPHCPGC